MSREVKIYLSHRLLGIASSSQDCASLCAALSVGSAVSIIDGYEALIETFQAIIQQPALDLSLEELEYPLAQLDISDWRLRKLRAFLSQDYAGLTVRDLTADDAYLRGEYEMAIHSSLCHAVDFPFDIDSLAVAAASYAMIGREPESGRLSPLQWELLALLTTLAAKSGSVTKAANDLSKLLLNIRIYEICRCS